MPWPEIISEQLELLYHSVPEEGSYGIITSLLTALFPHSESYQVVPRFSNVEYDTVIFLVKKRNVTVFYVIPTSFQGRVDARSILIDVARSGPHLPILYGINILSPGPRFVVYQFQENHNPIVTEEMVPIFHDLDRWYGHDLARERGEMKILEIVAEVKQMTRRLVPTPRIRKEFKARLPDTIVWQFERIGPFGHLKNNVNDLHGPFTSLLTSVFSGDERYQVNPTISKLHELNFIVTKNYIPIFILKVRPFRDFKDDFERTEADDSMRSDLDLNFDHNLIPKIYGLVAMGTSYAVYEMCTTTRSVLPEQIWDARGCNQTLSRVTKRWWENSLVDGDGFNKFLNIVSHIKKMVSPTEIIEPPRTSQDLVMCSQTAHKWQSLPADIVLLLLIHFFPVPNISARDPSTFPWFFGHICRHWRYVFTSSPRFWSQFTADLVSPSFGYQRYPPGHNLLIERAESIVKTCIERSEERPLTFTLNVLSTQPAAVSSYHRLLEILVSKSKYWSDISLRLHREDLPILSRANGQFPRLRSLEIFIYGDMAPDESLADLFSHSRPSQLSVENLSQWIFDWTLLKAIKLCSTSFDDPEGLVQMLQHAQSLEYLYLGVDPLSKRQFPTDYMPGILLPHLKFLYVGLVSFLRFVRAPSLELLCAKVDIGSFSDEIEPADAFFDSMRCLDYIILVMHSENIDYILTRLPMVNHLHLGITRTHHDGIPSFQNIQNAFNLKRLSISFMTSIFEPFEGMVEEIRTWKRNSDGSFDAGVQHESLPRLDALTLGGIWDRQLDKSEFSAMDEIKKLCEKKEISVDIASVNRLVPALPSPFGKMFSI